MTATDLQIHPEIGRPGVVVRTATLLGALGMLAFAAVNVVFERIGRFDNGPYAAYAAGLSVMNWLVVGLKLFGVAVLLFSVTHRASSVSRNLLTVLLWGAFGTLAIYSTGSVAKLLAVTTGLSEDLHQIDLGDVGYLCGTLFFAATFGVAAISYSRRAGLRKVAVGVGILGAPALLAGILVLAPGLLVALGIMPPV